jgi:ATP-dependent RNA helicase DDX46/PRP5
MRTTDVPCSGAAQVRGLNCPRPIKNWTQAGLSQKVLDVLVKSALERPLPIQAQALPIIMSGRDCIGIAKTGSGKTLAFVLPMLRHVKDQPPLAHGDGPIALIMAPTRELVVQIAKVRKGPQSQ